MASHLRYISRYKAFFIKRFIRPMHYLTIYYTHFIKSVSLEVIDYHSFKIKNSMYIKKVKQY